MAFLLTRLVSHIISLYCAFLVGMVTDVHQVEEHLGPTTLCKESQGHIRRACGMGGILPIFERYSLL